MPPASPAAPDRSAELTRIRFRRALMLMLMTLVVPGSAQMAAGRRETGRLAFRIWVGVVGVVAVVFIVGLFSRSTVFWLVSNTTVLEIVRWALVVLAVGWGYLFMDAWRLGDPLVLRQKQRLAMVGINGVLCFAVSGSLLFASHMVAVGHDFIGGMFSASTVSSAEHGRYNVLLLGGDSGATRWGLRPDSMTVASIDADTGKTILFGMPRNMTNFKFLPGSIMAKEYPDGYNCDTCELNSLYTWALNHEALFKGVKDPGYEATKEAIEGITGLKINYHVMINLAGFRRLVDAVGGVTLNVRQPIPIGAIGDFHGQYVPAGVRKLNGFQTLWFARSRMAADDYSRMARQKCVMSAMLHQLSPQQVLMKFSDIANASKAMISTDIPASEVPTFMDLALKAKAQPINVVSFVPPVIKTYAPDLTLIKHMVEHAIGVANGSIKVAPHRRPTAAQQQIDAQTTGGSIGSIQDGYAANQATDLAKSC